MQSEQDAKDFIDQEIEKFRKQKVQIEKDEQFKNQKAYKLSTKLENLKAIRDQTENEIIETTKDLYKCCTHEKTRDEHKYVEGGYLNNSESITTTFCVLCGVQVDRKVQYGSFG